MDQTIRPLSRRRRLCRVVLFLAPLAFAGCVGYRTTGVLVAGPGEGIRLRFTSPRTVVVHSPTADSIQVKNVVELTGRVVERTPELITLEVSRARTSDSRSQRRFGSGAVVSVVPEDATVGVQENRPARTVALVLALLGAAVLVAAATAPDPPPPEPKESSKY